MPSDLVGVFFFITVLAGEALFGFDGLTWAFPVTQMASCALGVVLFAVTGRTRVPVTAPDAGASASAEPGGQAAGSVGAGI